MTGVQTCALPICFPVTIGLDAVTMRLRDNEFNLQPCRLTLSNLDPVPALIKSEAQNFMIPVLRTACERPHIPGLLENLVAMIKRMQLT